MTRAPVRDSPAIRAEAIAASHSDAMIRRCAVIERLMIDGEDPDEPPAWAGKLVVRSGEGWRITDWDAGESVADLVALADFAGRAELVVLDALGEEPVAALARVLPTVRVAGTDPGLLTAHERCAAAPAGFVFPPPPAPRSRRRGRLLAVGLLAAVVLLGGLGVVARWPRPASAVPAAVQRVGPVSVRVPAPWRRTELSGDRPDDGRGLRAVFAAPDDGRRLITVVTALRPGATRESVAASLAGRAAQRGDDVVVEFSASSSYAGREVISYREAPVSGPAVRWYIVVLDGIQVSTGCQDGTGAESVDDACRTAVASLRLDPADR